MRPAGAQRPDASTVTSSPAPRSPTLVIAKLDAAGRVDLFNSAGSAHVLVDVFGAYRSTGDVYVPVAPARIAEVCNTNAFGAGEQRDVQITGQSVPAQATAVAINVTAVEPTAMGYLTIFPSGEARPGSSNLNVTGAELLALQQMAATC